MDFKDLPCEEPPMPTWLPAYGKKEWLRTVAYMLDAGTITKLDGGILACHCIAFDWIKRAELALRKRGLSSQERDGWLKVRDDFAKEFRETSEALLLTPASRVKVHKRGRPIA